MQFKKEIILLTAAAASINSFLPALAQDAGSDQAAPSKTNHSRIRHERSKLQKFLKEINQLSSITDQQKQQIESVVSAFKQDIQPLSQQAKAIRAQAHSQTAAAGAPLAPAPAKAGTAGVSPDQLGELQQQIREKTREAKKKILSILTPEQRQELKSLHAQDFHKHGGDGAGQAGPG